MSKQYVCTSKSDLQETFSVSMTYRSVNNFSTKWRPKEDPKQYISPYTNDIVLIALLTLFHILYAF